LPSRCCIYTRRHTRRGAQTGLLPNYVSYKININLGAFRVFSLRALNFSPIPIVDRRPFPDDDRPGHFGRLALLYGERNGFQSLARYFEITATEIIPPLNFSFDSSKATLYGHSPLMNFHYSRPLVSVRLVQSLADHVITVYTYKSLQRLRRSVCLGHLSAPPRTNILYAKPAYICADPGII